MTVALSANGAKSETTSDSSSPTDHRSLLTYLSSSSSDHCSLLTDHSSATSSTAHSLLFDHTIFRDPGQGGGSWIPSPPVHAFRAVWVSGLPTADARKGLASDKFDRLRTIRFKSALTRFRPSHARVIQGTVRGAANAQAAWQAFEQTMLDDLKFEASK
jgi:hypothetical protein